MEIETSSLLKLKKDTRDIHDYSFLLESKQDLFPNDQSLHRHELLGLPVVPFLGKYSGASYEFGQVLSLTSVDMSFKKRGDKHYWTEANTRGGVLKIPEDIAEILLNIPAKIEENQKEGFEYKKKSKNDEKEPKGKNQAKLTSFFGVKGDYEENKEIQRDKSKDKEEQEKNSGLQNPQYTPQFITTDVVKFSWIVQLNNIQLNQKFKNDNILILNYVMHPVLFPYISFEKTKRLTARTPIALLVPFEFRNQCGIFEFVDSDKSKSRFYSGLKIGGLRLEYSSVHLAGQSLCFSPNNMKLVVDKKVPIGVFWTVVLDETMQNNHCYLHWFVNESLYFGPLETICRQAKSLDELFRELEGLLGKDDPAVAYTKKIYMP